MYYLLFVNVKNIKKKIDYRFLFISKTVSFTVFKIYKAQYWSLLKNSQFLQRMTLVIKIAFQ